jgi:hypothetical protein
MRLVLAVLLWWGMSSPLAHAAVTISEIAWMGDTASANFEWIELYNNGDTVALDGWILSDGANLNIAISGTVAPGAYVVLERNRSDGQYRVNPPFVTYSGALVNTGATLTLRRADGSTEDVVAGGADWQAVGGNNVTKETAQYTAAGWRTGVPTPGLANVTSGTTPGTPPPTTTPTTTATTTSSTPVTTPTTNTSNSSSSSRNTRSSGRTSETVKLVIPNTVLSLTTDVQRTGYVNQRIPFAVKPSGISEIWQNSLVYTWNFGDMATGSGKATTHTYRYPGTYVVTVEAVYGRHRQIAQTEITILPVTLAISRGPAGEVQIHNNAPYDVDVSGYTIANTKSATFPPRSILGPKSTVTIAPGQLGDSYFSRLWLRDNRGQVVATWPADEVSVPAAAVMVRTPTAPAMPTLAAVTTSIIEESSVPTSTPLWPLLPLSVATEAATGTMPAYVLAALTDAVEPITVADTQPWHWSYGALALLLLVAIGGLLASRGNVSSSPREIEAKP